MSKLSFALSSLVAVVPAAFMMYLLVMGFISGMPMMLMVAGGLAVVCGVGIVLLPILGFIMGPKAEPAAAAATPRGGADSGLDISEEEHPFEDDVDVEDFGGEEFEDDVETFDDEELGGDGEWGDFEDDDFKDE